MQKPSPPELYSLPVVIEPAIQLGIPYEAGLQEAFSADAALKAVLVVGDVHYPQQVSVVDGPAARAAYWP